MLTSLPEMPEDGRRKDPPAGEIARELARAGCVAAAEEAEELIAAARREGAGLATLVARRVAGEPLAWITGSVAFAGWTVTVHRGVYVPRWQSEPLARRAVSVLPRAGIAVDLCTGSGAIAVAMARGRPQATVIGTDLDPLARRCAAANGIAVVGGSLAEGLPRELAGRVDVVTAVPPYVPTGALGLLPRDVREHEPRRSLDGGSDGAAVLRQVVTQSAALLRPGGTLLVELGADQDALVGPGLEPVGLELVDRLVDDEGDLRGIEARRVAGPGPLGRLAPRSSPGR